MVGQGWAMLKMSWEPRYAEGGPGGSWSFGSLHAVAMDG